MKKLRKLRGSRLIRIPAIFIVVWMLFYALYANRYTLDSVAYAAITGTKHDMSAGANPAISIIRATAVQEKCVFCHTPHSATKAVDGAPLWNHSLSTATYTILPAPAPTDSRISTPIQPDYGSRLCLSCHDGTVAIGLLINTPGSGSTYPTPVSMLGVSTGGVMPCGPTDFSCLGIDITGHHMVSIAFDQDLIDAKFSKCTSGQAVTGLKFPAANDPVKRWKTGHDNGLGLNPPEYKGVQCRSCHDPHNWGSGAFMIKGSPSNWNPLCDTCHYQPCP